LAHKIHDQKDPISKYIFKNILPETIKDIFDCPPPLIAGFLAIGLNNFIKNENFYEVERFSNVNLSEDANNLIAIRDDLKGGKIRILNRILMEEAYPDEICKTRISLITQSKKFKEGKSRNAYFINPDLRTFILIAEHLKDQIIVDRTRIEFLNANLKIKLKPFRGVENFLEEEHDILKEVRIGQKDIIYYRKRYKDNISILSKFINSNYVRELGKKYEHIEWELSGLTENESNLLKIKGIEIPEASTVEKLEQLNDYYDWILSQK
jgi:hypothetical protein